MVQPKTWEVFYGNASLPCQSEIDAKILAREFIKRGHMVSARVIVGPGPIRQIEPHHIAGWLAE